MSKGIVRTFSGLVPGRPAWAAEMEDESILPVRWGEWEGELPSEFSTLEGEIRRGGDAKYRFFPTKLSEEEITPTPRFVSP